MQEERARCLHLAREPIESVSVFLTKGYFQQFLSDFPTFQPHQIIFFPDFGEKVHAAIPDDAGIDDCKMFVHPPFSFNVNAYC